MSHKVDDAATATAMQDHSEHKPSHAALDAHDGHEPSGHGNRGGLVPALVKHAGHHVEMFRLRFRWSLLLTVPVILTSHMLMDWLVGRLPLALAGFRGAVERLSSALAGGLRQSRLGQGTDRAAVHAGFQRRDAPRSPPSQ